MRRGATWLLVLCGCPNTIPSAPSGAATGSSASDPTSAETAAECPPLRVKVDGQPVDFPYAYASIDDGRERLEVSILSGDIVSCNGMRLPAKARNVGLMPFREADSSDPDWERPESGQEEEITLSYFIGPRKFSTLDWRGGSHFYQRSDSDADPVMLSRSLDDDVVEVCVPRRQLENTAWRGKDDPRANRSTIVIEGLVRATMCGHKMSADDWHKGDLECDPLRSEEGGTPTLVDIFVDPNVKYGVVGFLASDDVTCKDIPNRKPLFEAHVSYEFDESPGVGSAETNAVNGDAVVSNFYYGNSISPVGPSAKRAICLHRPLYWYREGRAGFVRGELVPRRCPPPT